MHKTTTSQPLKDHYTLVDGRCYGSAVDLKNENTSADSLAVSSKYLSLFPNFIIGTYYPGQIGVHLNLPVEPGITHQKRIIYTTEGNNLTKNQIKTFIYRQISLSFFIACFNLFFMSSIITSVNRFFYN